MSNQEKKEPQPKRSTLLVRLPPEAHAKLKALAAHEHRSLSAQVTHMVMTAVLPEGVKVSPPEPSQDGTTPEKGRPWYLPGGAKR